MNITLCSAFRNAEKYLYKQYIAQVSMLDEALMARGDSLRCVWGEGDSTDGTRAELIDLASTCGAIVIDCTHNGPTFESIEHPQRFRQLAYVGNKILSAIPGDANAVLWVESDLVWKPETLIALIDRLQDVPCVAPMIMERSTGGFYDTWGFRRNGQQFMKSYPYHVDLRGELLQMDSVGSCWAINASLARHVRFPESDVVVGLCKQVYALGGSVFLDPDLMVWHP